MKKTERPFKQVNLKSGKKRQDLIFFKIEFGQNYNIPTPMGSKFYEEVKTEFPNAILDSVANLVKISTDKEKQFQDFFESFKKRHNKKGMKIKSQKTFSCFPLEIPYETKSLFEKEFIMTFSSDQLTINDVVTVDPKKAQKFEDFLREFNHKHSR